MTKFIKSTILLAIQQIVGEAEMRKLVLNDSLDKPLFWNQTENYPHVRLPV